MTKANKVLFITQEITPYVPESEMSLVGRNLPQAIQEKGREIRTFMPKWGNINERRNQLHEVIRLSGMNLIIDDTDHPLIIKVASIQSARMQVYFIDNDDYFQNRLETADENGVEYEDNDSRAIFYARGVLETVKKLRWCPDIIHCHGWMTALAPLYIKKAYKDEPSFRDAKVVFSVFEDDFKESFMADQAAAAARALRHGHAGRARRDRLHVQCAGDGLHEVRAGPGRDRPQPLRRRAQLFGLRAHDAARRRRGGHGGCGAVRRDGGDPVGAALRIRR